MSFIGEVRWASCQFSKKILTNFTANNYTLVTHWRNKDSEANCGNQNFDHSTIARRIALGICAMQWDKVKVSPPVRSWADVLLQQQWATCPLLGSGFSSIYLWRQRNHCHRLSRTKPCWLFAAPQGKDPGSKSSTWLVGGRHVAICNTGGISITAADAKPWLHPRSRRFSGDISEATCCWLLVFVGTTLGVVRFPPCSHLTSNYFSCFQIACEKIASWHSKNCSPFWT